MNRPEQPRTTEHAETDQSGYHRTRHAVMRALGGTTPGERSGGFVEKGLLVLILLNTAAIILETIPNLRPRTRQFLEAFEVLSVLVFTVEYVLRLWSCTASPEYRHPVWGRLRFALTPLALIDLLAVLPFFLPGVAADLRFARAVRLLRVFRVFKLGRYSAALATISRVVRSRKEELIGAVLILGVLLVLASSLMYFAEHEAQPDRFSSIPASMWWAIITITTIGYGDIYPVTLIGRCLAAVVAVLGIGAFALPTSILGSAFLEEIERRRQPPVPRSCPHCGKELA